jgi:hypothetical protein
VLRHRPPVVVVWTPAELPPGLADHPPRKRATSRARAIRRDWGARRRGSCRRRGRGRPRCRRGGRRRSAAARPRSGWRSAAGLSACCRRRRGTGCRRSIRRLNSQRNLGSWHAPSLRGESETTAAQLQTRVAAADLGRRRSLRRAAAFLGNRVSRPGTRSRWPPHVGLVPRRVEGYGGTSTAPRPVPGNCPLPALVAHERCGSVWCSRRMRLSVGLNYPGFRAALLVSSAGWRHAEDDPRVTECVVRQVILRVVQA